METRPMYFKLNQFERWLAQEMKDRDISVAKLAKYSGVHPNTIRNYLSEKCAPTMFNALCIVNALGYDLVAMKK